MEATAPLVGATILLVDDEPLITDLLRQHMKKYGFRVLTAGSGKEALAAMSSHADSIRLVITDMTMPSMTGIELARRLNELAPTIPVLISTGHDLDLSQLGDAPNIVGVVRKPYQHRVLAERIKDLLEG